MEDFILQVPQWQGEMRFDYGIVSFLLIWIVLFSAIMLCIWGYKYFQSMCLLVIGSLCGVVGIIAADTMTDNTVLKMIFFIMFVFFGICFFYFFSIILVWIFKLLRIEKSLCKLEYLFASLLGSILAGGTVYQKIYHNFWIVSGATLILAVWSIVYGRKRAAQRKPFHTYDDLCKLKPLAEVQKDA